VIDDQREGRVTLGEPRHEPQQLLRLGAHVERQFAVGEHRQHVIDPSVGQQAGIGISMDEVTHTDDGAVLPAVETAFGDGWIEQRHPSHHTGDAVIGGCDLEHQLCVDDVIGSLHQNDGDDSRGVQFLFDVSKIEASVERRRVDEPGVVHPNRVPDMEMAVDHRLGWIVLW
jgi:hypothetical protein